MDAVVRTKLNNQSLHSSLPGDRCDGVVLFMSLCSAFGRSVFLKYKINKLTKKNTLLLNMMLNGIQLTCMHEICNINSCSECIQNVI